MVLKLATYDKAGVVPPPPVADTPNIITGTVSALGLTVMFAGVPEALVVEVYSTGVTDTIGALGRKINITFSGDDDWPDTDEPGFPAVSTLYDMFTRVDPEELPRLVVAIDVQVAGVTLLGTLLPKSPP